MFDEYGAHWAPDFCRSRPTTVYAPEASRVGIAISKEQQLDRNVRRQQPPTDDRAQY